MKKRLLCFAALAAFILCVGSAFAADDEYIVLDVEGQGRNRHAAIEDAWLEGIRQAVGSFIDSKTELNDDEITERIIAYSRGLVEKYEITGVDDSRAGEGIYKLKMRVWVAKDLLKDGVSYATGEGTEIAFSAADIKAREKEALDAKAAKELESQNAKEKTGAEKAKKGAELLAATLARYKPEDFLVYRIAGKPEPVKDKDEFFSVPIEVTFNEKLYYEKFVPDLEKVLDQISAKNKKAVLMKQKNELRKLKNGEPLDPAEGSIILRGAELGKDYSIVVYDMPDRLGCKLYGFQDTMKGDVAHAIEDFAGRITCVDGFQLELQDEDKEAIYTVEQPISLSLLLSGNNTGWAFHPTLLSGKDKTTESMRVTFPFEFEMPVELQELVKSVKVTLLMTTLEIKAIRAERERVERERVEREKAEKEREKAEKIKKHVAYLNSAYGGKYLGNSFTAAQSEAIRAGTFDGMALGDYWTINGVNWRIADFDYLIRSDKAEVDASKHHVMIVPDESLYNQRMNSTNMTSGGYAGSKMRRSGLNQAKDAAENAFGRGHILKYRGHIRNDGTSGVWTTCGVELMTKAMVFGKGDEALSLFRVHKDSIATGKWYWLQDFVSAAWFALVNYDGSCDDNDASYAGGVRPAFAIY